MKKLIILALVLSMALIGNAFALPNWFDVWEINPNTLDQTLLGQISAIHGGTDAVSYYNYYSASGHPANPTPQAATSQVWMYYDNNDNLSFNIIHNADAAGPNYWNHVEWDTYFYGTGYSALFQDDSPENHGEGGLVDQGGGYMTADFAYNQNTDGGIVSLRPEDCCDWAVLFYPYMTGDISAIRAGSGTGNSLTLWEGNAYANTYGDDVDYISDVWGGPAYAITPHCTPEPGTLLLLGSGLLMGAGVLRRKRNQ